MTRTLVKVSLARGLVVGEASAARAQFRTFPLRRCGPDAVVAGTVCLDEYEASVWRVPSLCHKKAKLARGFEPRTC